MRKKAFITAVIVLSLLVLLLAGMQADWVVSANPPATTQPPKASGDFWTAEAPMLHALG